MDTREKIITEAMKLFVKNGYDKTSLTDVAKKLDITKPALYYHFKNKDELFETAANYFVSHMLELVNFMETGDDIFTFLTRLFTSFDMYMHVMQTMIENDVDDNFSAVQYYFFIYDAIKRIPDFKHNMNRIYDEYIKIAKKALLSSKEKGLIRDDLDYEAMAFELVTLLEGTFLMKIVNPSLDLERMGKKLLENQIKRLKP